MPFLYSGRNVNPFSAVAKAAAFETNAAHLFFQLVSRRHERGFALITSNRAVGETGCCTTATSSPSAVTAIGCARSAAPLIKAALGEVAAA